MLTTKTLSADDRIEEARWWVAELSLDLSPGTTNRLLNAAKNRLAELETRRALGLLEPATIVVDESVPF